LCLFSALSARRARVLRSIPSVPPTMTL
jgi:hypothetical protein